MTSLNYDFNKFSDLSSAIERINAGAQVGFENLTSEYLAASYAVRAAEESGYNDEESIKYHLDFLIENGAKFDFDKSVSMIKNDA